MALPPGVPVKTVSVGIASFFDGTLADGTATITAPVNVIHTPSNRPIFSSQISKRFVDGEASFNLAPTDAAGLNRKDFAYKLSVVITGALVQPDPIYFLLPESGPDTVDLDGLVTVPSSAGIPISVDVLTTEDLPGHILDVLPEQMAEVQANPASAFAVAQRAAFVRPAAGFAQPTHDVVLSSTSNAILIGVDQSNSRGFFLTSASSGTIHDSMDNGITLSADRTRPAGSTWFDLRKMVAFKGKVYLYGAAGGLAAVWSTTPDYTAGATWTWTQVYTGATGVNNTINTNFSTDGTYLYVGEYGDPTGGPAIWRSSDGTNWSMVYGRAVGNRHIHAVTPDPYNPGHIWATVGDGGNALVIRSTDSGSTWTNAAPGSVQTVWKQAVQISFSPDRVWFASDQPNISVYTIDRATNTVEVAATNYHADIQPPSAAPRNGNSLFTDGAFTNGSNVMTSASAAFVASDRGRPISSEALPSKTVYIAAVTSATQVTLTSQAVATRAGTGVFRIGLDAYPNVAYMGAVDPATGIFYFAAHDPNGAETSRTGFFYLPRWGGRIELLNEIQPVNGQPIFEAFIYNGFFWCGRFRVALRTRPVIG